MSDDIKELVKRLREKDDFELAAAADEAADALEAMAAHTDAVITRCKITEQAYLEMEAERDRLKAEMSGWSKSAMAHFDYNATLVATLQYLRTQAKNGTLHPQVVIQNVDKALGGDE